MRKKSEINHGIFVANMAIMLYDKLLVYFDELKPLQNQLYLLIAAAKIHDIGKYVGSPHNKIGAKIVIEQGIEGLNEEETLIVANLIRYHRGKHPKDTHKLYSKLNPNERKLVLLFAAILRIADVLDYEAENLSVKLDEKKIILNVTPNPLITNGFKKAFNKKKLLFEEVFNRQLILEFIK